MRGPSIGLPESLVSASLAHPRWVLLFWLLVLPPFIVGLASLRIETSTASVLDQADAKWIFYQESQRSFGGDEVIVLAAPADRDSISALEELARELAALPGVRRVDSLGTVPVVSRTSSGEASLDPLLTRISGLGDEEFASELARATRSTVRQILISDDASVVAVNVVLEMAPEEHYEQILEPILDAAGRSGYYVSGVPMFRVAADARTRSELIRLVPIAIAVIGALLAAMFRSAKAAGIGLAPGALGSLITLGTMGWIGVPLSITTVILPTVFLALGCAYSIHLLAEGEASSNTRTARLVETARPIALSALTTAIGFVGVSLVQIDVIRFIGGFGALGVLALAGATLTAVPAAISATGFAPRQEAWSRSTAQWLFGLALRHRVALVVFSTASVVVSLVAGSSIRVETDVIEWFQESDPVRTDYDFISTNLSGISPINIVLDLPGQEGEISADLIRTLSRMERELEIDPRVGRLLSIAGPVGELDAVLRIGEEALTTDGVQQILMVLESEPYFEDFASSSRDRLNVLIRANDNHSSALLAVAELAKEWWSVNGVRGVEAQPTGIMYEFARAEDEIALGQLRGLLFALVAVGVVLLANLRSFVLTALALAANLVPVAMVFGAMGLLGIPIDAGTVLVGNLVVGIAVDDTIHLITRYKDQIDVGKTARLALDSALGRVVRPLILTTGSVAIGFGALALSDFRFVETLGALMAAALILCLVADLVLLPALIALTFASEGAGETR